VELLNRRQKQDPTWLRIQLELARAKHDRSVAIKTSDSAASNNLRREASRLAREVARKPNPHSKLAAELLGRWGVSIEAATEAPASVVALEPATSFDDARQKAKDLIAPLSDQLQEVSTMRRTLAAINDVAAKSDQELAIRKLQDSVNQRANQALGMLSQAVQFSNKETPRADLNNVRYLQAYCHFAMRRYPEAAVIGKFLLEKYPTIEWSQQAAGLMVRSYEKMFDTSNGEDRETAKKKVIDSATVMMNVWAASKESAGAAVSATRVAVIDSDFEAAKEFFRQIPQDSPTRGQLASKIGQQIWGGRKTAKDDQERQQITQRAREFLQIAFESSDPASMNFSTAVASLYYVDACREAKDLDRAISGIESLLQNLDTNAAVSKSAKFRQSVYNSTLNCYLEAIGQKQDAENWINKSQSVIERMSAEAEGDPAAIANVSRVYRKVARDLKEQFEGLGSLPEKEQFADSLMSFFAGIGSVAKDGKTRLWAGSTLLGIGETLKLEGSDRKARELSDQAIKLVSAAKKAGFGNDKALELAYQHQLALAQRGSGDFAAAVESFEKILEKSNGINLQIDAAKTLLLWGIEKKNVKALTSSMNGRGEFRDPKTKKRRKRIMGWKSLVSATRSSEKLQEQFQECEYYSLLCRFRYGELKDNKKAIESAHGELVKALKRFPFLATGPWKKKFEQLLKDLEAAKK
jgi:tetratricopeptide (TPR) repeat protein